MIFVSVGASGQIVHNKRVVPIKKRKIKTATNQVDSTKIPKRLVKTENGTYCPPCGKG